MIMAKEFHAYRTPNIVCEVQLHRGQSYIPTRYSKRYMYMYLYVPVEFRDDDDDDDDDNDDDDNDDDDDRRSPTLPSITDKTD